MPFPTALVRFALPLAAIGVFASAALGDELNDSLKSLEEKLAKIEAEQIKALEKQGVNRTYDSGMRLTMQVKMLQMAIKKGDYDKAEQFLQSFGGYGMPPEIQEEWLLLVEMLNKEITLRREQALESWKKEVDAVVAEAKKACLEAKTSADLDGVLLKCAPLQMRRELQNTSAGQRAYRKLSGTANTLEAWANYLDFREAGNAKRANETLRNLLNNQEFPLLSQEEISSNFQEEADQLNVDAALAKIFAGVETPNDIPKALERLNTIVKNPMNSQLSGLNNEKNRLEAYQKAWEFAQKQDAAAALRSLEIYSGGYAAAQTYYDTLKDQITDRVLQTQVSKWTQLSKNPGETSDDFIQRILDDTLAKGDYEKLLEILKFASQTNRNSEMSSTASSARRAIDQYLAAKRFEGAGDNLAAATNYRQVVAAPTNKYIPTKEAEAALKALQEKDPQAFKSYEGVVLEELRALRTQIQTLQGRVQSRQYPPGFSP